MEEARREREVEDERRRGEAQERANQIWNNIPPAQDDHPYPTTKGVSAYGLSADSADDAHLFQHHRAHDSGMIVRSVPI
jgi:hypothetical protein